ncbi:histidine phosphatase family protein [Arthrobacter sp. SA17]
MFRSDQLCHWNIKRLPCGTCTLSLTRKRHTTWLRARPTADPIAERLGVEIAIDADLREQSYGAAEGTPPGSTAYVPPARTRGSNAPSRRN